MGEKILLEPPTWQVLKKRLFEWKTGQKEVCKHLIRSPVTNNQDSFLIGLDGTTGLLS